MSDSPHKIPEDDLLGVVFSHLLKDMAIARRHHAGRLDWHWEFILSDGDPDIRLDAPYRELYLQQKKKRRPQS